MFTIYVVTDQVYYRVTMPEDSSNRTKYVIELQCLRTALTEPSWSTEGRVMRDSMSCFLL